MRERRKEREKEGNERKKRKEKEKKEGKKGRKKKVEKERESKQKGNKRKRNPRVYERFAGLLVPAVLLEPTARAVLGPGANGLFSPSLLTWRSTWVVPSRRSPLPTALLPPFMHCSTQTLNTERRRLPRIGRG